jgi:hypothetical protein
MKTVYASKNVTESDKIEYAIDRVLSKLECQEIKQFTIDDDAISGCVVPVAEMYSRKCNQVERDGKKYLSCSDDCICIFAAENYAAIVTERTHILRPNGWGDDEDVIVEDVVYTKSTCRDMDGIFDLIYRSY